MQILENDIQGKTLSLRSSGVREELLLKYPSDLARSLGFRAGCRFVPFYNHKGEVLFRPVPDEEESQKVLPDHASAGGSGSTAEGVRDE